MVSIRKLLALLLLVAARAVAAAPDEIVSVLISRTGDTADVEIRFACANRLLGQPDASEAAVAEIRLQRLPGCAGSLASVNAPTRPPGRELAALLTVRYSSLVGTGASLALVFDRPVRLTVEQSGDLRGLSLRVRVPAGAAPGVATAPLTAAAGRPPDPSGPTPEQVARAEERARLAAQAKVPLARPPAEYVVNLRSTTEPLDAKSATDNLARADQLAYVADLPVDGQVWHRLRLGFFRSEAEANVALSALRARYPDAWVTRASVAERLAVRPVATRVIADTPHSTPPAAGPLADGQPTALLADARAAIIDQDYRRAIQLTTRILDAPTADGAADARELLGLARERNGELPEAALEYQRYLADYPQSPGAVRVGQRLAALTTARDKPRESIRGSAAPGRDSAWDVDGGFSQFYWRDSLDFGGAAGSDDQSAVFSDADVVVRHAGERFDLESRATVGYAYALSGGGSSRENDARFYNLYLDLSDQTLGLSTRLGRQALRNQGGLGRFDGALVSWQVAPDYRFNLLGGLPVYDPGETVDTSRKFYGFSVDVLNLLDLFDLNLFLNIQDIDGINDRRSAGAEVRYFGTNRSLAAAVDYDFGYRELASLLAIGNWTFGNGLTVNGRFDWRKSPLLTTENALVGQRASSIQELLVTYTEGEIRQLALDRSGALQSLALGASLPISPRFQVSADVTASRYDATPDSGGVRDTPDSGTLIYSYLSLIGTSLVREGDVSVLGLRYSDGGSFKSAALFLDTRFPVTRDLRLNPKLLVSRRQISPGDVTELQIRPGLRVLYRMTRRLRLEVEAGGEFGRHDGAALSNNSTGYYLNMGYTTDF